MSEALTCRLKPRWRNGSMTSWRSCSWYRASSKLHRHRQLPHDRQMKTSHSYMDKYVNCERTTATFVRSEFLLIHTRHEYIHAGCIWGMFCCRRTFIGQEVSDVTSNMQRLATRIGLYNKIYILIDVVAFILFCLKEMEVPLLQMMI